MKKMQKGLDKEPSLCVVARMVGRATCSVSIGSLHNYLFEILCNLYIAFIPQCVILISSREREVMNMKTVTVNGYVMFDLYVVERTVAREDEFVCTVNVEDGYWEVYMDEDRDFYGFYVEDDEVEK